jgi:hypothetical protein
VTPGKPAGVPVGKGSYAAFSPPEAGAAAQAMTTRPLYRVQPTRTGVPAGSGTVCLFALMERVSLTIYRDNDCRRSVPIRAGRILGKKAVLFGPHDE